MRFRTAPLFYLAIPCLFVLAAGAFASRPLQALPLPGAAQAAPAQTTPAQAAPAQPASVSLPDTPPGKLMGEWLSLCEKPDLAQLTRWHKDHLAKPALKHDGALIAAARDVAKCQKAGGYVVTQVQVDSEVQLAVFAAARLTHARSRLTLELDDHGKIVAPQASKASAAAQPAAPPEGGEVTGAWSGDIVLETAGGETRLVRVDADLKAEGASVRGAVTFSNSPTLQFPLTSSALAGKRLTFAAERNVAVYNFDLAILGADRMEGTVSADSHGEDQWSGRVTLLRSSK